MRVLSSRALPAPSLLSHPLPLLPVILLPLRVPAPPSFPLFPCFSVVRPASLFSLRCRSRVCVCVCVCLCMFVSTVLAIFCLWSLREAVRRGGNSRGQLAGGHSTGHARINGSSSLGSPPPSGRPLRVTAVGATDLVPPRCRAREGAYGECTAEAGDARWGVLCCVFLLRCIVWCGVLWCGLWTVGCVVVYCGGVVCCGVVWCVMM